MDDSALQPSRGARWLAFGFLAATVLACAVALSPNNVDPDLWGHVQYAEDALSAGGLHLEATRTYTAAGHRWINHENLSEFALAFGYRWLGPQGMLAAKCLLGLAVVYLMLRSALRQRVSLPVVCAFLLLVTTTLTAFWAMRPQLASFVFLSLLVVVLDRAFALWQTERKLDAEWLCPLPAIMGFWANAHGGFAAGYCVLVAYLGLRSIEAIYYEGRAAWKHIGIFTLAALASGLATLINPYGVSLHHWLADVALKSPPPEITEWLPPAATDAFFWPMVLLYGLTIAAYGLTRERRDWTQIIVIALVAAQSLLHSRHIPLAALLIGFWLPVHVQSMVARFRKSNAPEADSRLGQWMLGAGLTVAVVLLIFKLDERLRDMPVERDEYPVAALQYMADHDLEGKLLVNFNWAQYALAALPGTQVAFDGRFNTCYPQEVIDMHFDFLYGDVPIRRLRGENSGPINAEAALEFGEPDLVLIDRDYCRPQKTLARRDDFVLLYQDATAQLWGRRNKYDDPTLTTYVPADERRISDAPQTGGVTWPALPRLDEQDVARFRPPQSPPRLLRLKEHRS